MGPSPRVRGKLQWHKGGVSSIRSIPARAGETPSGPCLGSSEWVHPRACGGNCSATLLRRLLESPSPRVRGKLGSDASSLFCSGSIPARAGETERRFTGSVTSTVHPRACGGNSRSFTRPFSSRGPSPRVRGKLEWVQFPTFDPRSIPARAGETNHRLRSWCFQPVHPRACGGN